MTEQNEGILEANTLEAFVFCPSNDIQAIRSHDLKEEVVPHLYLGTYI